MRAVIQRVNRARVRVDQELISSIGPGLLVLLGVHKDDQEDDLNWLVDKTCNLRIFEDHEGKMNRSLLDTMAHGNQMLVVSQFTLYGDCRKGRRPGFSEAAPPDQAKQFYLQFIDQTRQRGVPCAGGRFQAHMEVELINDGPVTLILDSRHPQPDPSQP